MAAKQNKRLAELERDYADLKKSRDEIAAKKGKSYFFLNRANLNPDFVVNNYDTVILPQMDKEIAKLKGKSKPSK